MIRNVEGKGMNFQRLKNLTKVIKLTESRIGEISGTVFCREPFRQQKNGTSQVIKNKELEMKKDLPQ